MLIMISPVTDREAFYRLQLRDLVPDKIAVDVLPYALRLAHCEVSKLRQCDVDELPAEGTIRMYELMDLGLEILQKNARLVREWEDIFSFRYAHSPCRP
jgi:hypothetical protein